MKTYSDSQVSSAPRGPRLRSPATVMLALLSLSYFLAYFDRLLMAVVGEMVKHEFLLSDKSLSLLTGAAFTILYGSCGIAAGWFGDRFSRKRILVVALALWSCCTMACGLAQSFIQLALARAGVGIGEAPNVPLANSIICDLYPPAQRPMATAVFYAGGTVGILAVFILGTWAATHFGWRVAFVLAGPPGLLLSLLIHRLTREPQREAPQLTATVAGVERAGHSASSFGLVWNNAPLRTILLAGALSTFVNMTVVQWLPNFFIRSHGLSVQQVGLFFGPVLASGMTAGILFGGWLGNRVAARSLTALIWFSAVTMLTIAPIYLTIFWLPSLAAALAATFVGTAMSVAYSPCFSAAWQTLCDPRARGTAAGLASFANAMIGGAICSFLVGWLSDRWAPALGKESLRYALMATLVIPLLSGAMFMRAAQLTTRKIRRELYVASNPAG
jgi:MFS family permease